MSAIQAHYSGIKTGIKEITITLKLPLEMADKVYEVLGFPKANESTWVAIAPLNLEQA